MPSKQDQKKEKDEMNAWKKYIDKKCRQNAKKQGIWGYIVSKGEKEAFFRKREKKRVARQLGRDPEKDALQRALSNMRLDLRALPSYKRLSPAEQAAKMKEEEEKIKDGYVYRGAGKEAQKKREEAKAEAAKNSEASKYANNEDSEDEDEEMAEEEEGGEKEVDHGFEDPSDDEDEGMRPASNPVGGVMVSAF